MTAQPERRGVKSIAVNSVYLLGAHGINSLTRAIYAVALARFLGPQDYGIYSYGLNWSLTFLPIAMFGLDAVLSREIGRSKEYADRIITNGITLRIVTTLLATAACLVAAWLLEHAPGARQVLLVFALALVGRSLATLANSAFTAYEVSSRTFQQEGVFRLVEVPLGIAVLLAGGGMLSVAWVHASIWWAQAARGMVLMHRHLVPVSLGWHPAVAMRLVRHGIPLAVANICGSWVLYGPVVVFRFLGDSTIALGHLALVLQAFVLLTGVPFSIGRASLPVLSRAVHRADSKEQLFLTITFRATIILVAAVAIAATGLGPLLVRTVFGAEYGDAGALLGVAMWLLLPITIAAGPDSILVARGHMVFSALSSLAGAVVMTVTVQPLVARFEALGILLAAGLGMIVWGTVATLFVMQIVDLRLRSSVIRPGCAAVVAAAVFHGAQPAGPWLATVSGLATLLVAALLLRIVTPEEQAAIATILRGSKFPRRE